MTQEHNIIYDRATALEAYERLFNDVCAMGEFDLLGPYDWEKVDQTIIDALTSKPDKEFVKALQKIKYGSGEEFAVYIAERALKEYGDGE